MKNEINPKHKRQIMLGRAQRLYLEGKSRDEIMRQCRVLTEKDLDMVVEITDQLKKAK